MKLYEKYIDDVVSGRLLSGQKMIKAVNRHLNDIERSKSDDYPFVFSEEWADKYLKFISMLRLQEGELAKQRFPIQNFQAFTIALLFGWREKGSDNRRFRDSFMLMSKKNAKTTLMSAIITAEMYLEGEDGGQYLFAAYNRDQADIAYNFTRLMVIDLMKDFASIRSKTKVTYRKITRTDKNCVMKSVSKEAKSLEGKGASVAVIDEFHLHGDANDVVNNTRTGMVGRRQPLMLRISTAGHNLGGPCKEFYDYSRDVLSGVLEAERLLVLIWELDEGDDWKDTNVWVKANPNLGQNPKVEQLMPLFEDAINMSGSTEVSFKIKHLNMWVSSEATWISDELWMSCLPRKKQTKGLEMFCGLDLASVRDFSAFARLYDGGDHLIYKGDYYLPADALKGPLVTKFPQIKLWVDQGWIKTTPGNATDYNVIEADIEESTRVATLRHFYYDRFNSSQLIINLIAMGTRNLEPLRQTAAYLHGPIEEFERLVIEGRLDHGNDPVLRWMIGNAKLHEYGHPPMKTITKGNSQAKIDGVIAVILAMAAYIEHKRKFRHSPSVWSLSTMST